MPDATDRLNFVRGAIAAAAKAAGRDPQAVTLVAVSKGRSGAAIEELIAAGQRDFGENRVQEAHEKWTPLRARFDEVRLHEIGQLQSNKAVDAAALFDVIHSVDRLSLIDALAKVTRCPELYVQVNIGDEEQKGGCDIAEVPALVAALRERALPLVGLMAIPPKGREPAPYFALLGKIAKGEGLKRLSMGMSADYRAAVMLGATCVRIGSALFDD